MSFKKDLQQGLDAESKILNTLQKFFNDDTIRKTKNTFCNYDFVGKNCTRYELKTRNNTKSKYETTLIAEDKIILGSQTHFFIFNFTDGIYYIEYDEELFRNFERKDFVRNKRIDYNDIRKPYIFIPVKYLKPLTISLP